MNIINRRNKDVLLFTCFKREFKMIFYPEDKLEFYKTQVLDYYVENKEMTIGDYKFATRELKRDICIPSNKKLTCIELNENEYGERFGMLLMRFLNADFSDFYTAYNTFFFAYGLDGYYPEIAKYFMAKDVWYFETEEGFIEFAKKWYIQIKDNLQEVQTFFRKCVNYIYNLNGDSRDEGISHLSKLRAFTLANHKFSYLQTYYNISLENLVETSNNMEIPKDLRKIVRLIENKRIRVNSTLIYDGCYDCYGLCYKILELIVTRNMMPIKTCQNDGKYFIPLHRIDEIYCDYKHLDGLTCREIGAKKKYAQKSKQNPALAAYNKIYQTKIMRTRRNPDNKELKEQFENFKLRGTAIKKAYLENKISLDKYNELLKIIENDKTNEMIDKFLKNK